MRTLIQQLTDQLQANEEFTFSRDGRSIKVRFVVTKDGAIDRYADMHVTDEFLLGAQDAELQLVQRLWEHAEKVRAGGK